MNNIENYYKDWLENIGFKEQNYDEISNGFAYQLPDSGGSGNIWIYSQKDLFDIKVHNFTFNKDDSLQFITPKCISVTYYESISAVEIDTKKEITSGCVMTYMGGEKPYLVKVNKDVPIHSIGIEIWPKYYEEYLRKAYPGEQLSVEEEFLNVGITKDFGAMRLLLKQIKDYKGTGLAAKLFYESKVSEAIALIIEYNRKKVMPQKIMNSDIVLLEQVKAYIKEHLDTDISISQLSKIGCMGESKFKRLFKKYTGMTPRKYVQHMRVERAKEYLESSEMNIKQIAEKVGCTNAARFSVMFEAQTSVRPNVWRENYKEKTSFK